MFDFMNEAFIKSKTLHFDKKVENNGSKNIDHVSKGLP